LRIAASAAVAWVLTVAVVAARPQARASERLLAALALLTGLLAPVVARHRPRLGRHLGLTAFVTLCLGAWLLASLRGGLPAMPGPRAWLGAVAWGLVALVWGEPPARPAASGRSVPPVARVRLEPRRPASLPALLLSLLGTGAAAMCLVLAWLPGPSPRAVLTQTIAVAAALGLIGAASTLALLAGRLPEHDAADRGQTWGVLRASGRSLLVALLLALAVVGLLLWQG
jgi:hypothetical protein